MSTIKASGTAILATAVMGCAMMVGGCGASGAHNGTVSGHAEALDHSSHPLTIGGLLSVNGTYGAGCTNRASGSWSMEIASGATLDNAPLSVVQGNTGCTLTVTDLVTDAGTRHATPAIGLTTSYQGTASSFAIAGSNPIEFYANAKLSSVSFAADFMLTIEFSDDAAGATGSNTANFTSQSATATASAVPAPDYTIDLTGIVLQSDNADTVLSASGNAALANGAVRGQTYVVADGSIDTSFAAIDEAYTGGTPQTLVGSDAGPDMLIAVAAFSLVGTDLTSNQQRSLIVANTQDGVRGYEVFRITFHPATRP
jgi:hypothetical protein